MTTSTLYKELKQSSNLSTCREYWEIDGRQTDELVEQISRKLEDHSFLSQLEKLSEIEARLLYFLITQKGSATSTQIYQEKVLSKRDLEKASQALKEKYILFIRKSISQIKIVPHSYMVYPEIIEELKNIPLFTRESLQSLKDYGKANADGVVFSEDWKKLFLANMGQYHMESLEKSFLKDELEKHFESGLCQRGILFHDKFYPVYHIIPEKMGDLLPLSSEQVERNDRLGFITRLYELFYQLKTRGIYFTNKKSIRKHDLDQLKGLFHDDQELLARVLEVMERCGFVEVLESHYQIAPYFIEFLKLSVNKKYSLILSYYSKAKTILDYVREFSDEAFSVWDIAQSVFRQRMKDKYVSYDVFSDGELNEEDLADGLVFLVELGLVTRSDTAYQLSDLGRAHFSGEEIKYCHPEEKGGIIVNSNHSLMVYPDKISPYEKMLLTMFADLLTDGVIWQYQFSKTSIQRGVFLGFKDTMFIDCLRDNSVQPIPDNILFNIRSWAQKIRKVYVKHITILQGDEDILQLMQYDKAMSKYIDPVTEPILKCRNTELPGYVDGDEPIFIIREGEDLHYEDH